MYKQLFMVVLITLSFFSTAPTITFSFKESEIRDYIPICTNNITADKLYCRIAESSTEKCYEFLLYWEYQEGNYKMSQHTHDWEFIVVYTYPNGTIQQVNYDSWHYYIGRTENPDAINDTNVLMYVDPDFHYFRPDGVIRSGNITWQIEKQRVYELTDTVLYTAKSQVSFDKELYDGPFEWKQKGWFVLNRYTAFDSNWKAFWVVADKKFGFVNFEDTNNILTKWL
jgi:hypothetical protein